MGLEAFTNSFRQRTETVLRQLRDRNIVVLGDVMLDEFIWGDVSRISPEAPWPWSILSVSPRILAARRMCSQICWRWEQTPVSSGLSARTLPAKESAAPCARRALCKRTVY